MNIFNVSNPDLYIGMGVSLLNAIILCFISIKFLQIIQLSGYKISGYKVWLANTHAKFISRIVMLAFLSFACMLVSVTLFNSYANKQTYFSYFGLIFYIYFSIVYITNVYSAPQKTPLKQTYRMNRLIACTYLLSVIITFILFVLAYEFLPATIPYLPVIALTPLLVPLIVPLAHFIMVPIENLNNKQFILRAKHKLTKYPDLIKIGITGSVGKTSTKFILNSILSEKFDVCMTPHSFNTPMGLTKVVLDYLKPNNQVLIAEMGAKQMWDIKFLCDLIQPKYGILTGVGSQHLATFGSLENIAKTKNELIKSLPKEDGVAIFNLDNEASKKLYENCECNKIAVCLNDENSDVFAKNIVTTSSGTSFTLCFKDEEIDCKTKLLGEHNLKNILLCAALAHKLGLSLEELKVGIAKIEPINHRLELKKENGLTILDDSFNSSVEGSNAAIEVLKLFKGNKIVVTPGLVELGYLENEANFNFGKNLAGVANFVIIVNQANKEKISEGLKEGGFNCDNIIFANNLIEAKLKLKEITKKGDVVLFENDLPDNYT
ncbi:MAG: UDP-N-acetylmuramoyl-tripeptide--D-alanyl-D-alanine ligase [Clostridia bacterium]|nr:UDP-N-acetylmuramoyl-tripeptide--D-alanyl-D-alanine ligase [Clostridia bacterium]